MKLLQTFIAATLLITIASSTVLSQTKKRTVRTAPSKRRTKPVEPEAPKNTAVAPGAATTTPSGLTYIITHHGNGRQPQAGETVSVHYTGLLGNGVKFDSSVDRGQPFAFKLGVGQVIKGWDEGIAQLHVGDQATLIIPPNLGYGERGAGGVIPPNATLIFIVELIDAKAAAKSN